MDAQPDPDARPDPDTQPSVAKRTLAEFFSAQFSYSIPWFQRSYAWEAIHALNLLEDIDQARREHLRNSDKEFWYFLGTITLAKATPARIGDVEMLLIVDGQQRIISLTILFAVLRDLMQNAELSTRLNERIWTTDRSSRVIAETTVRDCLVKYVMSEGATGEFKHLEEGFEPLEMDASETIAEFNISETRVIANRMVLRHALEDKPQRELEALALFLLDNTLVMTLTLENETTARQIFTTAQRRVLELKPANVFKADVLDLVAPADRAECSEIWDYYWNQLGADKFDELLTHMSIIKQGFGSKDTLESDLITHYRIKEDPRRFVLQDLGVLAQFSLEMRTNEIGSGDLHGPLNRRLQYLGWITHKTWMIPALHWLKIKGVEDAQTLEFFTALERFAYLEMLARQPTSIRNTAYQNVVDGINARTVLDAKGPLNVSQFMSRVMIRLRSNKIGEKSHKTQIFLRANAALEGDEKVRPTPRLTVEHALPKKPNKKADWNGWFPTAKEKAAYLQRLGNLLPLTRTENNEAGNKNYDVKRALYEKSVFVMANDAARHENWGPKVIDQRTQEIIDILLKAWDLK